MIDALPPDVGGWSETGDSMVIFDAETFASKIIPQYFKHNNFRSFVRQLNFYGFRKLRADASGSNANRWEFKHGNFRKGRPELLVQIRRAEHYDYSAPDAAAQKQRQTEMERDIADLRRLVADLQGQVDDLRDRLDKKPAAVKKKRSLLVDVNGNDDQLMSFGEPPDISQRSLDVLAGGPPNPSVYAQSLEGKPLKRHRTNNVDLLEGQPLERRLSTFETSRLDSLIRTLNDDSDDPLPHGGGLPALPLDGPPSGGGGELSSIPA